MLLGAASAVTGVVGEVEEVDAEEAKQKKKEQDYEAKVQASVSGLHKVDAAKARASAMLSDHTIVQRKTTQKVAG